MPRVILLPKFDQQCAKRIAGDAVCNQLLSVHKVPPGGVVRIAICQDGRTLREMDDLHEVSYLEQLFGYYLRRTDIDVQCYTFSFEGTLAQLRQRLTELSRTDIFFMTGFSVGTSMSRPLRALFARHAELGYDERNQANDGENLLRMFVNRVQYNQMVYMGVCGGACCAGKYYWCQSISGSGGYVPGTQLELFNFLRGVSKASPWRLIPPWVSRWRPKV